MRKILILFVLSILIAQVAEAAEIYRHNFFEEYDPTSSNFAYTDDRTDTSATGDQVAVNTYLQKSIQIIGVEVGEYIEIRIEGRSLNQTNTAVAAQVDNFAILDTVNFGAGSADSAINQVVDVTEFVDFLRVGIAQYGTNASSKIDIEGIFTNLEK